MASERAGTCPSLTDGGQAAAALLACGCGVVVVRLGWRSWGTLKEGRRECREWATGCSYAVGWAAPAVPSSMCGGSEEGEGAGGWGATGGG
jgi:hypothetical protein